ncbi:hypothetical protein Bhyg_00166 [Pseudolycoriella hygida]|uniref:LepB N-terminal domain-containing protein n=1 Tax=Pseudolycoriella hygida TaxID=35572 RepID=A0A9Q0N7C3_9DIPT|nr:hypothetical protein Bhyg_00166 [Pseudolycoriella hygida]
MGNTRANLFKDSVRISKKRLVDSLSSSPKRPKTNPFAPMNEEIASPFEGLEFQEKKTRGAGDSGKFGGIYKDKEDPSLLSMVKCEKNISKNISEFLGSQFFQKLSNGAGAKVSLVRPKYEYLQNPNFPNEGSEIYVKSEFFKNYHDMYQDMDERMSGKTNPNKRFRKDGRPLFMGTRQLFNKTFTNAFKELNYQGFEQIAPASLLIGDFDIHSGNIGVIREPEIDKNVSAPLPKLVRIDFGSSFNRLKKSIHPHSHSRHFPGMGPTNHYREFPRFLSINEKFASGLIAISKIKLDETIDESFAELSKYYNEEALAGWVKVAMPDKFKKLPIHQIKMEDIKIHLKKIMKERVPIINPSLSQEVMPEIREVKREIEQYINLPNSLNQLSVQNNGIDKKTKEDIVNILEEGYKPLPKFSPAMQIEILHDILNKEKPLDNNNVKFKVLIIELITQLNDKINISSSIQNRERDMYQKKILDWNDEALASERARILDIIRFYEKKVIKLEDTNFPWQNNEHGSIVKQTISDVNNCIAEILHRENSKVQNKKASIIQRSVDRG